MIAVAVMVALVLLGGLAVLQVLVAAGLPYGRLVWGGAHRILPRRLRIASAASVGLYVGFAALLLARAGAWGAPGALIVALTWVLFGYFAVGVVLNALSRSRVERRVMTPTCLTLAAVTLVVALG